MALDERDYHSYQLPEHIKERRIRELKNRFERATSQKRRSFQIRIAPPRGHADWTVIYLSLTFIFLLAWIIY